jgi:hypothetical protein
MHGEYKMPGGKLIVADLAMRDDRLADVSISGDFFLEPDTALAAIDWALEGLPAKSGERALADAIEAKLGGDVAMYGISPRVVAVAVLRALEASA